MSYSSKSEHPADLIPNSAWALQNARARRGAVGSVTDPSCAWGGQAGLHLGRCVFVGAQKGSSLACDVFSVVVEG